ncbi:MalY/PatB family protein [Oceanirhabdus sp. W0125-5]|uniref:MalY/PatB family protein n=1 Tax=Oceanirhabdus sp. W0125-5 TaxID=2999116 RepID=UPI0022F2BD01|nr:MalY/PatB family protein [Oceanirhabdus sp. W0125-5]WBW97262.1 pyridoxal phosphate-dependent aminotransferase [Oceanirhabdus sp. W0125-5]
MKYNFDEVIDRRGTNALKWDPELIEKLMGAKGEDLLPMWVADMDFRCPQVVIDSLKKRAEHGIFGYSMPLDEYYSAMNYWYKKRYNWEIKSEWVINSPGIVPALNFIIRALTEPRDKVIIQQPVYYPFKSSIENNDRVVINNALINKEGKYVIDFEDLENKAKDSQCKLLILCSPHNPVGRVWEKEELQKLGEICNRYNVIVVADEIHSDLILSGNKHTTYGSLGKEFENNCVICTAPSKTFNLAALQISNIIIPNEEIREKIEKEFMKSFMMTPLPNIFAIDAIHSVYSPEGEEWLEQLLTYLDGNADFIGDFVKEHMPNVRYTKPEGTYLAWLDFREVESDYKELERKISEEAKVVLDGGSMFGTKGRGFIRINYACPRSILEEGLTRIKKVFFK